LRTIIAYFTDLESSFLHGEVGVEKSYFGEVRKDKHGRGAAGKISVFGCLERKAKVYTQMISDVREKTLMPMIHYKIRSESIVYTNNFNSYNVLDASEFKHLRINHSTKFAEEKNHINGIENFWSQAKRYLQKFNGIPKHRFHLFLKECEFRFYYGSPKLLLSTR